MTLTQPRTPAGSPTGGQFAGTAAQESALILTTQSAPHPQIADAEIRAAFNDAAGALRHGTSLEELGEIMQGAVDQVQNDEHFRDFVRVNWARLQSRRAKNFDRLARTEYLRFRAAELGLTTAPDLEFPLEYASSHDEWIDNFEGVRLELSFAGDGLAGPFRPDDMSDRKCLRVSVLGPDGAELGSINTRIIADSAELDYNAVAEDLILRLPSINQPMGPSAISEAVTNLGFLTRDDLQVPNPRAQRDALL